MNPQILNSHLRPSSFWKAHHASDAFVGTLVFLLGIAVEEGIHLWRTSQPHVVRVLWTGGEVQTNFIASSKLQIKFPMSFEVGVSEDGVLVWREKGGKP